jgi:hypothetical protein
MRQFSFLLTTTLFAPALASPAIFPDTIARWQKGAVQSATVSDQKIWTEYGLDESETTTYSDGPRKFTASAWRFSDTTGAFAAFELSRPPSSQQTIPTVTDIAAETNSDRWALVGNYLFFFEGYKPSPEEMNHIVATVPKYTHAAMPPVREHLPPGPVPNSERYILGPESLAKFAPAIPSATAAFHFSSEAITARYQQGGHEDTLVVFNFPAMEMARKQLEQFEAIPHALVKRSGPLVAVVLNGAGSNDAEKLLAKVRYQAQITIPEHVPTPKDNPINLFWNIFLLCLVLAAFCLVSGVMVGGLMYLFRRSGASGEGDDMISLHLSGRPR